MDAKANFQRVMLECLIKQEDTKPGSMVTKETIDSQILKENPDKPKNFVSADVYYTLVDKHEIVSSKMIGSSGKGYRLNIATKLSKDEINSLLDLLRECFVLVGPENNWQIAQL